MFGPINLDPRSLCFFKNFFLKLNFFPRATPGPSASFYKNQNLDKKFPATFHPQAAHEFDIKLTKFSVKKNPGGLKEGENKKKQKF